MYHSSKLKIYVELKLYLKELSYFNFQFVADLLEGKNSEGMTPLFQSVSCNNLECVQFLVTSGANIDTRDSVGRTPVALAAYQVLLKALFIPDNSVIFLF